MRECPFEVLGVERRPMPDLDFVREAYFARAEFLHPDKPGGSAQAFDAIRRAYEEICDPARRLALLAGGENGHGMGQPPWEIFDRVDKALRLATEALKPNRVASESAVVRALRLRDLRAAEDECLRAKNVVREGLKSGEQKLRELDSDWPDVEPEAMVEVGRLFKFLQKWDRELDECAFALRQARAALQAYSLAG